MRSAVDLPSFLPFLQGEQTLLTPGRRLAREISTAWLKRSLRSGQPELSPRVEPADAWLERAWSSAVEEGALPLQRLLNSEQQTALWLEIIREDASHSGGFTLTQPRATAQRARASWEQLTMHGGLDNPRVWELFRYEEDCAVFARWAKKFDARLSECESTTRYQAYSQLLTLPAQSTPLALYAFPELPPVAQQALEHLSELKQIAPKRGDLSGAKPTAKGYGTREDELAAAASWAYSMSQDSETRNAIILLDLRRDRTQLEYFLRAEFECLDAQYNDLPVNFSTGMPLSDTPMYRDALLALEWEVRPLLRHEWLALMRSRFLPGLLSNPSEQALALVERLFQSGFAEISINQTLHFLSRYAPELPLKSVLMRIRGDKSYRGKKSLQSWGTWIRGRLNAWGWPSHNALDSIEYQQLDRLDASLEALASLSAVLPHKGHETALALWRQSLANVAFQPKTPYDSVQVMGPLEAIGLEFDGLWVCGAQQGSLPRTPRLDPFLPAALQKQLNFPSINAQALQADGQTLLEIWHAGSAETVFSYHESDRGQTRQPSSLLSLPESIGRASWFPPPRWQAQRQVEAMSSDEKIPVTTHQATGGSGLIRDQSSCAFRAFIKHRIKVRGLEAEAFGFTAIERGLLLHEIMFYLWRDIGSQHALIAISEQSLLGQIEDAANAALRKLELDAERRGYSLRARVGEGCWELERAFCCEVVAEWMTRERARKIPFTAVTLEEEFTVALGDLRLSVRPDRIDKLEDGRHVVLDYKSNAPAKSRWLGERPREPQLPLYTLLDNTIEGVAFAPLVRESQFISLGNNLGLATASEKSLMQQTEGWSDEWSDVIAKWTSGIERLAADFLAGLTTADPLPGVCQHCDLQAACRIDQLRRTDDAFLEGALEE